MFNSDQIGKATTCMIEMACSMPTTMQKRMCLGCGGELAMAFNPSENARGQSGAAGSGRSTSKWRCSTCGQVFTAEQLRAGKRASTNVVDPT
jgi:uncharacterized protein with PIN domain